MFGTLRMIDAMVGSETLVKQSGDTMSSLTRKKDVQNYEKIQESIAQIKQDIH